MLPEPCIAARGAQPCLVADPHDRVHGVIVRGGEAVLGSKAVLDGEDEEAELVGQAGARVVERPGGCAEDDEAAAVEVEHHRELTVIGGGDEHAEEGLLGWVQRDVPRPGVGGGGGGIGGSGDRREVGGTGEGAIGVGRYLQELVRVHWSHEVSDQVGRL